MKTGTLTALSALGLFVASASWALHQQIEYIFASLVCSHGKPLMWSVTVFLLALLAAAAVITLRLPRWEATAEHDPDDISRPRRFLASMSLLAVLLFLFAIFLQASAMLFLPNCVG
jgi:hypothetical protein